MRRRDFLKCIGAGLLTAAVPSTIFAQSPTRKQMPDVIVLLPGIMGSVLQKDGKDVWAVSGSAIISGLLSLGDNLDVLAIKNDSPDVDDLGDGIVASRLFAETHLIPGFWKVDGYSIISRSIQEAFDVTLGKNYFEFPYDWRRDNRAAARKLARWSRQWLASWRTESGNQQAKLVLIGHSMGGLVARYFIECMEGWRITRRLVTFGTPYRGSLNALNTLSNGFKLGSIKLAGMTKLARSFTGVYQLLTRYPCYDPGDGKLVRVGETTGIPNVDPVKAKQALQFYLEMDACVEENQKNPEYRQNFKIHPIVGSYQPTLQSAKLVNNRVEMFNTYPGGDWDGDGTVPEVSAVPIELSGAGREMYVAQRHSSIQNTPVVLNQLMKVLGKGQWENVRRTDLFDGPPRFSLQVKDSYSTGESVRIRAVCSKEVAALSAVLMDAVTDRGVIRTSLPVNKDGFYETELPPLAEGVYRITVGSPDFPDSVTDVFIVAGI